MNWIDRVPLGILLVLAVWMCIAPWPAAPEPHLVEKLRMLGNGTLSKPIDWFDLVWHAIFPALAVVRLVRMRRVG